MRHAALLGLAALALAARSLAASSKHPFPIFDEIAYIELARDFAERGAVGSVACHLRGECREDNRHPLHPALLAAFMSGAPEDFARGKLLSLALAIVLLLTVYFGSRRVWGGETALLAAAWLSWTPSLAYVSHFILADGLFAALFFAACAALARAQQDPWKWLLFGAFAGASYLAKGNGHLLFAGGLLFGVWAQGRGFLLGRSPYFAVIGFSATAGVLLIRNLQAYGELFYNVHERIVWLDHWNQYWVLSASPEWAQVGWEWYVQRHSPGEMLVRFGSGLAKIALEISAALAPFFRARPLMAAAAGLAAFGVHLAWKTRRRETAAFLIPAGLMALAFAWTAQPMAPDPRYLLPIAACLAPFAAGALLKLAESLKKERRSGAIAGGCAAGSVFILLIAAPGLSLKPLSFWRTPEPWAKAAEYLCAKASGGYVISPASFFSTWDRCRDARRPFPLSADGEAVRARAMSSPAPFVVLDRSVVERGEAPEEMGRADRFGPTTLFGWRRCFSDGGTPSQLLIYSPRCPD